MPRRYSCLCSLLLFAFSSFVLAKNPPASDPTALALAAQSIAALTGGTSISDVTLSGSFTWIAGSDNETGAATLYAKGLAESRVDLNLGDGLRSDIRNDTARYPQGSSVVGSGTKQPWPLHNCWINAAWFFPALSVMAANSDPTVVLSYIGQEKRNGATVQHLQSFRYAPAKNPSMTALNRRLSTMDIYLDSASLLPVAMRFDSHPDNDALTNIAVEVRFSNYRAVNGVEAPLHIQKFVNGALAIDVSVSSAVFNSGLSGDLFFVQQ